MRKILLICCLTFNLCQLHGQEVIASGGNFLSNSDGSFSFTIGEVVNETFNSSSAIMTQGFQQSFLETNRLNENTIEELFVFPNPCNDYFEIVNIPENFVGEIVLLNIAGSEVLRKKITGGKQPKIDVSLINQANYLIFLETISSEYTFLGNLIKIDQ